MAKELSLEAVLDRYADIHKGAQRREDKLNMLAAGLSIIGTLAIQLSFREPLFTISMGAASLLLIGSSRVMHLRSLDRAFDQITTPLIVEQVMAAMRSRPSGTNPPEGEGFGTKPPPPRPPSTPDASAPVPSPIKPPPGELEAEEKVPTLL